MSLKKKLKAKGLKINKPQMRSGPLWRGPEVDGITQSYLKKFLGCKERFKVLMIDGLEPIYKFNSASEYGNMWHECEEAWAAGKDWRPVLLSFCKRLLIEKPDDRETIDKWYMACKKQFEIYVEYWEEHEDVQKRTPLLEEYTFRVPYELPSGRTVYMLGKIDSADIVGKEVWLQENKTKGIIEEHELSNQLSFDLQTMYYVIALQHYLKTNKIKKKIAGVRYNVVRRPLSGGKGSIKQRKASKNKPAETKEEYWDRLQQYFIDEPEYWFKRWNVYLSAADVEYFKRIFLEPCLEHLCLWYDQMTGKEIEAQDDFSFLHYRIPNGVHFSYGSKEISEYLRTGSTSGLRKVDRLFKEL